MKILKFTYTGITKMSHGTKLYYNKGNAKRGVSPHLKIWPGDLENQ